MKKFILLLFFFLIFSCNNSVADLNNDNDSDLNDSESTDEVTDNSIDENNSCVGDDNNNEWDYIVEDAYFNKIISNGNEYIGIGYYIEPYDYGNGYYENVSYSMIAKLKDDFSVKWMFVFEESGYGKDFNDFFVSEDGYIYAAGTKNEKEFLLAKIDDSPEFVWQREWQYLGFHISGTNIINSIKPVSDGIYAGGFTAGHDEEGKATFTKLYMSKVDYEGNLIWEKTWGPGGSIVGSFEIDEMENIYMTGYTVGSLDGNENAGKPGDCSALPWGPEGSSCPDPFLIKMDKNGEIEWSRQFGSEDINIIDFGIDVAVDKKGDIYVLSYSRLYGGERIIVRKFNKNGDLIWETICDNKRENYFEGTALYIDEASSLIYVSGQFFENKLSIREGIVLSFETEKGTLISELSYPLSNRVSFRGFVEEGGETNHVFGHEIVAFNQFSPDVYDTQPVYKAGIKRIDSLNKNRVLDKSITKGDKFERETILTGYSDEDAVVFSFEDSENNIFTAGNIVAHSKGKSIFLSKYDKDRKLVWKKSYGSSKWDDLISGSTDSFGNIILSGTTYGNFEGKDRFGVGDIFVIKLSSSGEVIWIDQTGSDNDDWVNGMHVDEEGNIYLTGGTWGSIDDNTFIEGYGGNLFVGKWDNDGKKEWLIQKGPRIEGMSAITDKNGNIYVAGRIDVQYFDQSVFQTGVYDSIIFKFNKTGLEQWARIWGSVEVDSATDIAVDSVGDIFVTGYTFGAIDGNLHLGENCPGGYCPDAYLTKWDSTGKKKWTREFGTEFGDRATTIAIDENDGIYVSGTAGKNRLCEIENDIFLIKSDTSGNLEEIKVWGTAGEEKVNDINISNGNIIISGFTTGGLDDNDNLGGIDGFVTVIEKY